MLATFILEDVGFVNLMDGDCALNKKHRILWKAFTWSIYVYTSLSIADHPIHPAINNITDMKLKSSLGNAGHPIIHLQPDYMLFSSGSSRRVPG